MAEFTLRYDTGIVETENEIYELAKSLGVIYHPVSANTGKTNNMMWAFASYPHVKGETNMKFFVTSDKKVLDEVYQACLGADDVALQARNEEFKTVDIDVEDL